MRQFDLYLSYSPTSEKISLLVSRDLVTGGGQIAREIELTEEQVLVLYRLGVNTNMPPKVIENLPGY